MTQAEGSISQRRRPCSADVGNAWWLLCQASPNVSGASHRRLRDSSFVAKRRRPKKWHRELIEYVAWALIVLALVSEGAATLVYWRRSRGAG